MDHSLLGKFIEKILQHNIKEYTHLLQIITAIYFEFEVIEKPSSDEKQIWSNLNTTSDNNDFHIYDQVFRFGRTNYKIYKSVLIVTLRIYEF